MKNRKQRNKLVFYGVITRARTRSRAPNLLFVLARLSKMDFGFSGLKIKQKQTKKIGIIQQMDDFLKINIGKIKFAVNILYWC